MAENPMVELAQTVMISRYGLDEGTYGLVKYTEGAKNVTIGMTDGIIPVTASFPVVFLEVERMKRWSYSKKELYVKNLLASGEDFPEVLQEDGEFVKILGTLMGEKPPAKVITIEDKIEELIETESTPTEEVIEDKVDKVLEVLDGEVDKAEKRIKKVKSIRKK